MTIKNSAIFEKDPKEMNIESWATHFILELDEDKMSKEQPTQPSFVAKEKSIVAVSPTPSYYRSKAFTNTIGINPLIIAADPLLTLITKLRKVGIAPDPVSLQQHLGHEFKAFENNAQISGYHSQIILAAKYILCALIDEIILLTQWGSECQWEKYLLLNHLHDDAESLSNDRFFLILDRSLQDPSTHVDLLELFYLCLRFGYEGKYRTTDRGHLVLKNLTENVFECIRQQRDEFSKSLLVSLDLPNLRPRKRLFAHLLPPLWLTSSVLASILLSTYIAFYIKLIKISAPIDQLLTKVTQQEPVS